MKNYIKNLKHHYIMNIEGYQMAIALFILISAVSIACGLMGGN